VSPADLNLEGVNRYNPGNVPALETSVNEQCTNDTYNLNANLALLKFYQFNPDACKVNVICKILLKAITRFPDSDLTLCVALLNEQIMDDENVKIIMALSDALETASILRVWPSLEACASLTADIKGFTDAIRRCIFSHSKLIFPLVICLTSLSFQASRSPSQSPVKLFLSPNSRLTSTLMVSGRSDFSKISKISHFSSSSSSSSSSSCRGSHEGTREPVELVY